MREKKLLKRVGWFSLVVGLLVVGILAGLAGEAKPVVALYSEVVFDSDGANDEPGQKDLTRLSFDPLSVNPYRISWNWDIVSLGGANTADGCALFTTDSDGFANYALCNAWKLGQVQVDGYPVLYSCNNSRVDRCAGSAVLPITFGSSCYIVDSTDDPFPASANYPRDTKSVCQIFPGDVGGATTKLLDVCSYPSASPGSDPSDCVVISADAGNLEVIKNVVPDDLSTNWVITVTGPTPFTDTLVGDDTTQNRAVTAGSYTIVETAGSGTILSNYDTTWSCTESVSATSTSGTGTTIGPFAIAKGQIWDCTFTNTKRGSIIVEKQTLPDGAAGSFTFTGDATGTISDGGQIVVSNLAPGTYTSTEDLATGFELTSITCDDTNSTGDTTLRKATFVLEAGETVKCTFTNRANVDLAITKDDGDYLGHGYLPVGGLFTYTIEVDYLPTTGTGGTAYGVSVTDTLDPFVRYVAGSLSFDDPDSLGRSCTPPVYPLPTDGGGVLTCDLKTMAPGENVTITFQVTVLTGVEMDGFVEFGKCTQGFPSYQNGELVDICNNVTVVTTSYDVDMTNNSDSEPTDIGLPTAVDLISFEVTRVVRKIRLDWVTGSETNNLGFNLYRSTSLKGKRVKLNSELIMGNPGGMGGEYTYYDNIVKLKSVYYYWLESVDIYGDTTLHDPVVLKAIK